MEVRGYAPRKIITARSNSFERNFRINKNFDRLIVRFSETEKLIWSGGDRRHNERRRKRYDKFWNNATSSRLNVKKLNSETLKNVTPLTKSLLGLVTIFTKEKF